VAKKNPPWQRDELILALDLYVRHGGKYLAETHDEVVVLSAVLNALPIHPGDRAEDYRNPNGVSMKLLNFRRFDPAHRGAGLTRGNKLEEVVWEEFANDPDRLRRVATAILGLYAHVGKAPTPEPDEEAFPEGRVLYLLHRTRERNPAVIEAAKAIALAKDGRLACRVCTFCFAARYGQLGEGFIEGHHTRPVSEMAAGAVTKPVDIALVCSNCHRMLHRRRPWLAVGELGELLV
jgi:5-methylcytosine-specific restriction protein A